MSAQRAALAIPRVRIFCQCGHYHLISVCIFIRDGSTIYFYFLIEHIILFDSRPTRGTSSWVAQWCGIEAVTSRGSWCGTLLHLIEEGEFVDLSMDTMHLKDPLPLVLFGFEGSALSLPLFRPSHRITMLCHCSSTMNRNKTLFVVLCGMAALQVLAPSFCTFYQ